MLHGLLIFRPGIGLVFVTSSNAALSGVAEHESGLASGLNNTAFQIGAALGVAVVSRVAVSQTEGFVSANGDGNPALARTEGIQAWFVAVSSSRRSGLRPRCYSSGHAVGSPRRSKRSQRQREVEYGGAHPLQQSPALRRLRLRLR